MHQQFVIANPPGRFGRTALDHYIHELSAKVFYSKLEICDTIHKGSIAFMARWIMQRHFPEIG